jgi:nitrite reductase/ring-hydroxylating ferredoxin subunit
VARVKVCATEELGPGQRSIVPVGKFGVGVFNVGGAYYALTNYCPHRGAPLCKGWLTGTTEPGTEPYQVEFSRDGEILRCPWHGWEFDITDGATLVEPRKRVRSYPVLVEGGAIYLEVPDSQVKPPLAEEARS